MPENDLHLPSYDDLPRWFANVDAARRRLRRFAHLTPLMHSATFDRRSGASVYFKCENLQRAGAFKFRGAFNALSRLNDAQRAAGVIGFSSGNHAQAVACAGNLLGIDTHVVMPRNAPRVKRAATEQYGATVIDYDPGESRREELARRLVGEHGYTLIPPFDHPDIIAGQATAALELLERLEHLDALLVPCGGGGLLSGSAISVKALCPRCKVIGVEPEQADDAVRSFRSGRLQTIRNPQTIADGTRTESLGEMTFGLIQRHVDDMLTVSESAIAEAVHFLFQRTKLVVEPSGALGAAALLSGALRQSGRIGVILSGGNIDDDLMLRILRQDSF